MSSCALHFVHRVNFDVLFSLRSQRVINNRIENGVKYQRQHHRNAFANLTRISFLHRFSSCDNALCWQTSVVFVCMRHKRFFPFLFSIIPDIFIQLLKTIEFSVLLFFSLDANEEKNVLAENMR